MRNYRKSDPELARIVERFAYTEVAKDVEHQLKGNDRHLAILSALMGCGGVDLFALELERALDDGFDPVAARALGVPQRDWKRLQQGETVEADGRTVRPDEVCGPARRGIRVVFSGDTAPCPQLEDAARGADLLICDATYDSEELAPEAAKYGHSTFGQTAQLAARAGVRRLWLAHYSPRIETPADALPLAQAAFPQAECGFDGKAVTLRFEEG